MSLENAILKAKSALNEVLDIALDLPDSIHGNEVQQDVTDAVNLINHAWYTTIIHDVGKEETK